MAISAQAGVLNREAFGTVFARGSRVPSAPRRHSLAGLPVQFLILLAVALLLRAPLFGNPVIHSDEQFYLLVGDRLLDGQWPFVDIWDRKPVGLFLIYAAIRLLGGSGIVEYQLVATLAAAATASIIARMAMTLGTRAGAALGGGIAYLIWLMLFDGSGGQSPVFYNLAMAAAGLVMVRLWAAPQRSLANLGRQGALAMLIVGVAIQIKYTTVIEGAFFGILLLWGLMRAGAPMRVVLPYAIGWALLALLPTFAAWGIYAARGAGWTFLHANFLSVFERGEGITTTSERVKTIGAAAGFTPLALLAWHGWQRSFASLFVVGWAVVALLAILAVGTLESHYFMPLLVPLTVLAATGLPRRALWSAVIGGVALVALLFATSDRISRRGNREQVNALVGIIRPHLDGCMFVFGSEPILYHLTGACLPTRYVFRSHLSQTREANAIGVDQQREVARVLASRPAVIVVRAPRANSNPATLRILRRHLAQAYRSVGAVRVGRSRHYVFAVK